MTATFSLGKCYEGIIIRMDSMAKARISKFPDDAVLIDDLLLKIRVWAVDVRVDKGSLEWAQKLEPLCSMLLDRFEEIEEACSRFEEVSKERRAESSKNSEPFQGEFQKLSIGSLYYDARHALIVAVERLTAFVSALKASDLTPKDERTEETARSIQHRTIQHWAMKSLNETYFALDDPLPGSAVSTLLGAFVSNYKDPLSSPLFSPEGTQYSNHLRTITKVSEKYPYKFSLTSQKSSSLSAVASLGFGNLLSPVEAGVSQERNRSTQMELGMPLIFTTETLSRVEEYVKRIFDTHKTLGEEIKSLGTCFLIAGIMTANQEFKYINRTEPLPPDRIARHVKKFPSNSDFVFAVRYRVIRWKRWTFGSRLKIEDFKHRATFL